MKHSLQVVGQPKSVTPAEPEVLDVAGTTIVVEDTGSGSEARRFAQWMIEAGATSTNPERTDGALRILIGTRVAGGHDPQREVTNAAEAPPDFVLGSARRAFAERLVESIGGARP